MRVVYHLPVSEPRAEFVTRVIGRGPANALAGRYHVPQLSACVLTGRRLREVRLSHERWLCINAPMFSGTAKGPYRVMEEVVELINQ